MRGTNSPYNRYVYNAAAKLVRDPKLNRLYASIDVNLGKQESITQNTIRREVKEAFRQEHQEQIRLGMSRQHWLLFKPILANIYVTNSLENPVSNSIWKNFLSGSFDETKIINLRNHLLQLQSKHQPIAHEIA